MDTFQPLLSEVFGIAGLFDALPVEVVAGLVSFGTSLILIIAIRIAEKEVRAPARECGPESHTFQLGDGQFLPLSDAAGKFLHASVEGQDNFVIHSANQNGVPEALSALEQNGTAFSYEVLLPDGRAFDVSGRPSGNTAFVTVSELGTERRRTLELENALEEERTKNECVLDVLEKAPFLAWRQGSDGNLRWSNATYRALLGERSGIATALEKSSRSDPPGGSTARVQITGQNSSRWLDVSEYTFGQRETMCLATDVTPQVEAEASLSRFVETLTGTFAHLPIGLAIFDHDRRLGMFNPALGDLLKLAPAWLAGQPTLREFLEQLRENRQMPDQKDFVSWRRQLSALEEGAVSGNYSEIWTLPSGQNFRVVGRPHPQGALAFLFEDISGAVQLEERRRAEYALNQTLVDRLSEAIAVFDTSGKLSFSNIAFKTLWGSDAPDPATKPEISTMAGYWQSKSEDTAVWSELQGYASGATDRTCWSASIQLLDGRKLTGLFAPMPDGSTLTVFQAVAVDTKTMPAGDDRGNMMELETIEPKNFFFGLEDILLPRGVRLDTAHWNSARDFPVPARALRRIAWNMILAVVEFAPDATLISIACDEVGRSAAITAGPGAEGASGCVKPGQGGVAFRVLRQFVERQGGTLTVNWPTTRQPFSLACDIPLQHVHADPPHERQGQINGLANST